MPRRRVRSPRRCLMMLSVLVAFSLPYGLGTVVSASQLGPLPEAVRSPVPLASLHLGGTTGVVRSGSQLPGSTCTGGITTRTAKVSLTGSAKSSRITLHVEAVVWAGPVYRVGANSLVLAIAFKSGDASSYSLLTLTLSGIGTRFSGPTKVTFYQNGVATCHSSRPAQLTLSGTGLTLKTT